jgi:hypothetical protein
MSWHSRPRWTRRDQNQSQIMQELRQLGAVVWDLADRGNGVLDLMVFWRGVAMPVEVKRPGHESDLTENETCGIAELRAVGIEVIIATSTEDVINQWPA